MPSTHRWVTLRAMRGSTILCLFPLPLLLVTFSDCRPQATTKQLRSRAAFDLKCAEDYITLHEIDDRTVGARGCGSQATC